MTVDLRTTYLGLELRNPLVISACPLSERPDVLARLEDAGAAAAVFPSIFEEQIAHDESEIQGLFETGTESFAESLTYLPEVRDYNVGPDGYLRRLDKARRRVSIPIIASLNGASRGGWIRFARMLQDAGADALELNVYFVAADPDMTGDDVERRYIELVGSVREAVTIPLAVKVGPFFSSFAWMARRLVDAGADGLVLFNRFVHPDIDLENLTLRPDLVLSEPHESRLPMTWIALLRGQLRASLAATSGVHRASEVLKLLLVGADVTMVASTLYRHGAGQLRTMLDGVRQWLEEHEYASVEQMKGSMSQEHCPDPTAFERVNYMKTLASFSAELP